ncbi:hypothetical protein OAT84_00850 [Gammaproteobacteria bacterium]|nr:hypothetical protein [Gammaproteobacteria bacterium]
MQEKNNLINDLELLKQGHIDPEVIWALEQLVHLESSGRSIELISVLDSLKHEIARIKADNMTHAKVLIDPNQDMAVKAKINRLHDQIIGRGLSAVLLNCLRRLILGVCLILSIPIGVVCSPILISLGIQKTMQDRIKRNYTFSDVIIKIVKSVFHGIFASVVISLLAASVLDQHIKPKSTRLKQFAARRLKDVSDRNQVFQFKADKEAHTTFIDFLKACGAPISPQAEGYKHAKHDINKAQFEMNSNVDLYMRTVPTAVLPGMQGLKRSMGNHTCMTAVFHDNKGNKYYLKDGFDFAKPTPHKITDLPSQKDQGVTTNLAGLFSIWRASKDLRKKRYDHKNKDHLWKNIIPVYYPGEFDCMFYCAVLLSTVPKKSDELAPAQLCKNSGCTRYGGKGNNWHSECLSYFLPSTPANYTIK